MNKLQQLIDKHAELLEQNPYCYFELAYTRRTGWMAWVCSKPQQDDEFRKVLACGQGETPEEAAKNAIEKSDWMLVPPPRIFDLVAHLHRQIEFSENTFGPGLRTEGLRDHILKELIEIEANPTDLMEWVDIIMLGLDGAWRAGHSPEQIAAGLDTKLTINERRKWPDWRTAEPGKAIEHVRDNLPEDYEV